MNADKSRLLTDLARQRLVRCGSGRAFQHRGGNFSAEQLVRQVESEEKRLPATRSGHSGGFVPVAPLAASRWTPWSHMSRSQWRFAPWIKFDKLAIA